MERHFYYADRDARSFVSAELARGTEHYRIVEDLLFEPRFAPVFAHIEDPEEVRQEAVDLLNAQLDELETWAA
jgi:hypothetical protein